MRRLAIGLACLLAAGFAAAPAVPAGAADAAPDLAVTISWGAPGTPHVRSGQVATWQLTVTNIGTATAPAVDVIAGGSDQFGRFTSSCGQEYCTVGDLAPGETLTVTFSATGCLIQAGDPPARRVWWVTGAAWTAGDTDPTNNRVDLDVRITGSTNTSCFSGSST